MLSMPDMDRQVREIVTVSQAADSLAAGPLFVLRCWRAEGTPAMIAIVACTAGSTPREEGAWIGVSASGVVGTIGGGRLEWDVIAFARSALDGVNAQKSLSIPLGPEIGQCCGGRVDIRLVPLDDALLDTLAGKAAAERAASPEVWIHGAGHVGRALALALSPLPFQVTLLDQREDELARVDAPGVRRIVAERPSARVADARPGAAHVVMTHSHALDSLIAAAVLERGDFRYLGLIGSATKKALFLKGFRETGVPEAQIARVVCPIGGSAVRDKRPEVIAALAAAEITTALLGD
ncbi:MAG: xanthine dehydrogenase accessory protein XdhC [Beijerinckiaceae bacterium]